MQSRPSKQTAQRAMFAMAILALAFVYCVGALAYA